MERGRVEVRGRGGGERGGVEVYLFQADLCHHLLGAFLLFLLPLVSVTRGS